jgi:hypothetical protein
VRISLPRGSGQCLLLVGVVDEHDCLEAGQVLVNDGSGYMEAISVLVGRSPVRTKTPSFLRRCENRFAKTGSGQTERKLKN